MTDTSDPEKAIASIVAAQPPFADLLGLRVIHADPDRLVSQITVTPQLLNRNGTLHGGAVMAICDNNGGTATFTNLKAGQGTVTIESKTNFLRSIPAGDLVTAETTPIHKGRKTMIWQTTVRRSDGKVAAIVTQTQIVLDDPKFG